MKPCKESPTKTRHRYDPVLKHPAQTWLASGKAAEVASEELSLSPGRLFTWGRLQFPNARAIKSVPTVPAAPRISSSRSKPPNVSSARP